MNTEKFYTLITECVNFTKKSKSFTKYDIPSFNDLIKEINLLQTNLLSVKTDKLDEDAFSYYCYVVEELLTESTRLTKVIRLSKFTLIKSA